MKNKSLKEQLDSLGFAVFFIMVGVLWLLPAGRLPEDSWLIGFALIVFIISIIKYFNNIKVDWFFIVMAFVALAFGLDQYIGIQLSFFPIVFILIGVSILFGLIFGKGDGGLGCGGWGKWK